MRQCVHWSGVHWSAARNTLRFRRGRTYIPCGSTEAPNRFGGRLGGPGAAATVFRWEEPEFRWEESVCHWEESVCHWEESVFRWEESVFHLPLRC